MPHCSVRNPALDCTVPRTLLRANLSIGHYTLGCILKHEGVYCECQSGRHLEVRGCALDGPRVHRLGFTLWPEGLGVLCDKVTDARRGSPGYRLHVMCEPVVTA